ncbi:MAG: pentapeptide repeat-containing protein [Actinomycetota bacterium]|nr:pentapeptide repeat-containing protein [Actinomycetota bacterium]
MRLGRARARQVDLSDADLQGANLRWADLRNARLGGADLRGADLLDADLGGAWLDGADLSSARHLSSARFRGARATSRTRWPAGFRPRDAGVRMERVEQA